MIKDLKTTKPIGIFDSGIGGLTVAQAIVHHLPKENIIYFGDTAHMPYGEKSTAAIQAYAVKIAQVLMERECKLILIACNSASAAAFDLVKEYIASQAIVMNVIDPVIKFVGTHYPQKVLGLIGTRQTIHSHVYKKKIDALCLGIKLTSSPANLLASAIEEFGNHHVIDALLEIYLSQEALQNIDALVLGCTHYPIIKDRIVRYYQNKVVVIDSSDIVAQSVKRQLQKYNLLNDFGSSTKHFYVSDYTGSFANNAKLFFKEAVTLEHFPLWD